MSLYRLHITQAVSSFLLFENRNIPEIWKVNESKDWVRDFTFKLSFWS